MNAYLKIIYRQSAAIICFAALFITATALNAQTNAKPANYGEWGVLGSPKIAPDGKWVTFSMAYKDGRDTLFVAAVDGGTKFTFPKGTFGSYGKMGWLALRMDGKLLLFNPASKVQKHLGSAGDFTFSASGKYLIYDTSDDAGKSLHLYNLLSGKDETISAVSEYKYNANADAIVFATGNQILLYAFDKNKVRLLVESSLDKANSKLVWQEKGDAITFLTTAATSNLTDGCSVGFYDISVDKAYSFNLFDKASLEGKQFPAYSALQISKDCKRVFIPLQTANEDKEDADAGVEIWNASAKEIHPRQKLRNAEQRKDVWVWWPETGKYSQVTDSIYIEMALSGDQKHALLWDPRQNEPHPNLSAPVDYYLYNVETGAKEILLEKQTPAEITTLLSPGGKYLAYFRDKNWFVYNFTQHTHTCLTCTLTPAFFKEDFDWPEDAPPYGNPGWTEDDAYIILYDKYDIWRIRPDGSEAQKITDGRQCQTINRLCLLPEQRNKVNYDGLMNGVFKSAGPYVIRGKSIHAVEYSIWQHPKGMVQLITSTADLSAESFTDKGDIALIEQTFRMSPTIVVRRPGKKKKALYKSNSQLAKMVESDARVIEYSNSKGELLKGTLYYPVNYKEGTKYPMIVHIYQKQAWDYQRYVIPSLENVSGFNIRHLTLSGYFVFLPDIAYEMGRPAESALNCVTAAVSEALNFASIDRKKIGLIGHSYGGYETNYIISQTEMFAAAVGGSAINDLTSFYHYVVPGFERPNFWFTEHGQFRMAGPYFLNREGYMNNSPLYHAEQINTPLLSWAGRNDTQVHYFQMLELHLALRRLGKVNYALLYNGQGHVISAPELQKDLTLKISDWFGYYLKGQPKPAWMAP